MKRFGILVLLLVSLSLLSYGVFAAGVLSTPAKVSLSVAPGDNSEVSFTITNTGDENLTNLKLDLSSVDTTDSDDNEIALSYEITGLTSGNLSVGNDATVTISADVDNSYELGEQTKTITLSADGASTDLKFTLNVRPYSCTAGIQGDLNIDISDPDEDQEYDLGDTVAATVNVENNGDDSEYIVVEAALYDIDDSKKISSYKTSKKKISDGDDYDFEFNLKIDEDFDTDHEIQMFVKAYKSGDEESQCSEAEQDISVVEPEDKVTMQSFTLSPSEAQCGTSVEGIVDLFNVGANDEVVTLTLQSSALGMTPVSTSVNLGTDSSDDSEVLTPSFKVPLNAAEGQYVITANAKYAGETVTSQQTLTVYCPKQTTTTTVTTPVTTGNNIVPSTTTYTQKGTLDYFDTSNGIPMSVWILVDVLLVAGVVALLVLIFRRRK